MNNTNIRLGMILGVLVLIFAAQVLIPATAEATTCTAPTDIQLMADESFSLLAEWAALSSTYNRFPTLARKTTRFLAELDLERAIEQMRAYAQ